MLLETLEGRQMFSVGATAIGPVLFLNGTTSADRVTIVDTEDGLGTVKVYDDDVQYLDDQSDVPTFSGVKLVIVATGDGDDSVMIVSTKLNAIVSTGRGNDIVGAFATGNDADATILVDGGDGADSLTGFAAARARISLSGGAGNDDGVADASAGGTVAVDAGAGDDGSRDGPRWELSADGAGSVVTLDGGSGNDWITVNDVTGGAKVTVSGGLGDDYVAISGAVGGAVEGVFLASVVTVRGGGGSDTIDISGSNVHGVVNASGDAGDDTFVLASTVGPDAVVTLAGGAGNDKFSVTATVVSGADVTVDGGAGKLDVLLAGQGLGLSIIRVEIR